MVTRLTGGETPADGGDPRTFPAIHDEVVDELERLDNATGDLLDKTGDTMSGDLDLDGNRLTSPHVSGVRSRTRERSGESGTVTLDAAAYDAEVVELNGETTIAFSGFAEVGAQLTLLLRSGGESVSWPSEVGWVGGDAPDLSSEAGEDDLLVFWRTRSTQVVGSHVGTVA